MSKETYCQWKLVDTTNFKLGMQAERCGEVATHLIVRTVSDKWKSDLPLCANHCIDWVTLYFCKHPLPVVRLQESNI